jgi:hypothetical protein
MRFLIFLMFTGISFGQIELVQNNWPTDPQGYNFYPDADVTYESRVTNNAGLGVPGIPYKYTVKQYACQGFHTHECANGTVVSRPGPAFLFGETGQVTDANGIARADIEFNGFAGWYTICTELLLNPNPVNNPLKCVNTNTRYSTGYYGGGGVHYLERYSGGRLPYDSNSVNQPQTLHWDSRHVTASGLNNGVIDYSQNADGYTTRWATTETHFRLLNMSAAYKTATTGTGGYDLLDVTRISLPDGGIYDNDVAGVAPGSGNTTLNWDTRVFEEHARGTEIDITMPQGTTKQDLLYAAVTGAQCQLGIYTPTGTSIGTDAQVKAYWRAAGVVHISCKPGQSLRGPQHPGGPAR